MADAAKNEPQVSKLHVYSFGIVAMDKPLSSKIVEVTPVESFPMSSGTISNNATKYEATGINAQGQSYTDSIDTSNTVQAEWMPLGSNRVTPPDVRAGERVMLWRMGDSDKYYWVMMMDDLNLRKLETVVYAWNGSPNQSDGTTATTSYFFEVSTHNKMMHLHTSNANGEVCQFDVQINGGQGIIQMQDDIGNFFFMDAVNRILQMQTADGTILQLNQKSMTITIPETWTVQAKNGKFVFQESFDIKSPVTNHNGDFNELGAFGLNGDMTTAEGAGGVGTPGVGKISIKGNAELLGELDVKGNVTAVTIEASESVTAPNIH